jgi:RES domain-containing protein
LSLAALELLAHVDVSEVPDDLVALSVEVPDAASLTEVMEKQLPADWRNRPDHPACIEHGNTWIASGETLLLRVPSALIPHEYNYLLNPAHPGAASLVSSAQPFSFDRRLLE